MTEQRLTELESRVAFQEDLIQSLDATVAQQQKQIEHLEIICRTLLERIRDQSNDAASDSLLDNIPPHY